MIAVVLVVRASSGRQFVEVWSRTLPDKGAPIALSSPNVATLEGVPAVVVGDRAGQVYAFSLARGDVVQGWPATTRGIPVDSTPSVAELKASGDEDAVFVGVGNSSTPTPVAMRLSTLTGPSGGTSELKTRLQTHKRAVLRR